MISGGHLKSRTFRLSALAATVGLLAVGCGARVTQAQIEAYRQANGIGSGTGTGAVASGTGSAGTVGGSTAPAAGSGSSALGTSSGGTPLTSLAGGASGGTSGAVASGTGGSAGSRTQTTSGPSTPTAPSAAASQGLAVSSQVCKGLASGPGVSATEIDVGNVSDLTGPVPGLFLGAQHGITAFAAYINSVGGICGRRLVVKSADDDFDASQNATAVQSLAGSVLAFVGSFSSDDEGGASVMQSDGVPDIGEALSTQRFELPNNFSPEPRPAGWNLAPYILFKQKFPTAATHMAVLTENDSTAVEQEDAQVAALESIGYKFVYTDNNIEPTQTDFSADAQAMKSAGAQGVVFQATAPFYADLAKAIQNVGLTPFPLGDYGSAAYDTSYIADAGSAANGTIVEQEVAMFQGEDAASVPMVALEDKWYKALYNAPPDLFANWSWMSGVLFIDGLNAGSAITRPALLKGLGQVNNFTAGGLVATDDPAGKKPPTCFLIVDVTNGRFVRDASDPATGFDCANAPDFYYYKG